MVERLLQEGHDVAVLDDFSSGRMANLDAVANHPQLTVHQTDISNYQQIESLFTKVDWVFHLAGLADIVPSIQNPLRYHRANVDGTATVLEASRVGGVKRFVYAASSSCYGIPDHFPTPESAPIKPMYPYALAKYLGEECVLHWGLVYKLPCVSLRLFNVYGPRSRTTGSYGAVFGVFLAQKLAGKPFTVVGDGTQTRDFTFVTDVAEAFLTAAESEVAGEVLNVGSGAPQSINHLVGLLGGEVAYVPKRPGEPDRTFADTGKISRLLNWKPRVNFDEGVRIMLEQADLWREAPVWDASSIEEATRDWFTHLGSGNAEATPAASVSLTPNKGS